MPEDEVDQAIESGRLFNTVGLMMAEREKRMLFEDVKSRHDDIITLEKSIRELHEIFQDVSMLVDSQGEMLNHIAKNVDDARECAERALKTVVQAKKSKERFLKLKLGLGICFVISLILLFIIAGGVFCVYLPFVCNR